MCEEITIELFGIDRIIIKRIGVKELGDKWVIHKTDKDPFPSNPHAHSYDRSVKLDLSNGDLYRKGKLSSSISKKQLLKVRQKFEEVRSKNPSNYEWLTMPELTV